MNKQFQDFTESLENWFDKNKRDFPWRQTKSPYQIWVSEVMSHQTQIQQIADKFYPQFIKKYPNIDTLATAKWAEVYPFWDGLGCYNRGKNLLKSAKLMVHKFQGRFPENFESLCKLPGIGKYTAAAILAFAFDKKIPAIDTNISKIIKTLWPQKDIVKVAQQLVELSSSGKTWNSAMMDLAAELQKDNPKIDSLELFFTPEILQKFRPKPAKKKVEKIKKTRPKKCIEVGIACIWHDGQYLVQTRPNDKSFAGFWEFPGGKREKGETFRNCVKREILEEIGVKVSVRPHFYQEICHFKNTDLLLRFHRAKILEGKPKPLENQKIDWIKPEDFFTQKFLPTNHKALKKLQKLKF